MYFVYTGKRQKRMKGMFTFELELPCQYSSIDTFDTKAAEALKSYTDSYRSLVFIIHELVINSLEASIKKFGSEAARYSIKLIISHADEGLEISVQDFAGGMDLQELEQLGNRTLGESVISESGRGLMMIQQMVDEFKMNYEQDGLFTVKVRKEGVNYR
ncbi:ATP-binding protein [Bacillus sp. BGMRC 2118]|nr:ATP-binding protein [Bacillus sp. BGMRC 2118]